MYLLDSQQVMDLLSRDSTRQIFEWLAETEPRQTDLFVSIISVGQIADTIEQMPARERNHWRRLLNEITRLQTEKQFDTALDLITAAKKISLERYQLAILDKTESDIRKIRNAGGWIWIGQGQMIFPLQFASMGVSA